MHHFHELVTRMRKHGWQGRPVLAEAMNRGRGETQHYMAWTATHRLAAARAAKLTRIPVVLVRGGTRARKLPLAAGTTTDYHRYTILRNRRDPAATLMAAEIRINADADRRGVL